MEDCNQVPDHLTGKGSSVHPAKEAQCFLFVLGIISKRDDFNTLTGNARAMRTDDRITAIIIDDELNCISNLRRYLEKYCPAMEVVQTAATLADATALIRRGDFQVAFLDIEFCGATVFHLLDEVQQPGFSIVFVTAYDQYAVKAFRVEALDYILKPLSQHDVVQCYQKIRKHFGEKNGAAMSPVPEDTQAPGTSRKIILREREHVFVLQQADILYLKAMGAYTEVVFSLQGRIHTVVVSKTLSVLEKEYSAGIFFRVHKSYLINLQKVTGIRKKDVVMRELGDRPIPVAKRRIHDLLACLNQAG